MQNRGFFNGFGAIYGLAAHIKRGMMFQKGAKRVAHRDFVFDDEDAFGHRAKRNIARRSGKMSRVNPVYGSFVDEVAERAGFLGGGEKEDQKRE